MRILLCALAAIFVLGGAGAGAYFYFSGKTAQAADGAEVGDQHDAHKKSAKKDKGHGEALSFVELDPLILPIVDNNGVSQIVTMVISLEVTDAAAAATVTSMSPRLKDAFIQDMYGVLNRHAALKGGVIQVSKIKERLNLLSSQVVGENIISDVLLQVVQQRPI